MFIEEQNIILELFSKDHVTLKTRVMTAENSALLHRNKLHLKINYNRTVVLILFFFL